jgi:hypothetical protein
MAEIKAMEHPTLKVIGICVVAKWIHKVEQITKNGK